MVIRFVDSEKNIREEFVGFYLCEGGTAGVAIKELIPQSIADLGLSMDDCRGQCYDGAGSMAGRLIWSFITHQTSTRESHICALYEPST